MKSVRQSTLFILFCIGAFTTLWSQNDTLIFQQKYTEDSLQLANIMDELDAMSREERAEDSSSIDLINQSITLSLQLGDTIALISNIRKKLSWFWDTEQKDAYDSLDRELKFVQASYGMILRDTLLTDGDRYNFSRFSRSLFVLVDSGANLSFDSILSPQTQAQFTLNELSDEDMDSAHVYWVKIRLRYVGDTYNKHFLLPNDDDAIWQNVEFYTPTLNQEWQTYHGGGTVPIAQRMTHDWRDLYVLQTPNNLTYTVYFRLQGFKERNYPSGISFLHLLGDFLVQKSRNNTRVYIFIGILIFQFLFFLLWFMMTKEPTFIPYLIYILSIVAIALSSIEFGYWFSNPDFDRYNILNLIHIFFAWIAGVGLIQFTKVFLNGAETMPKWNKVLKLLMILFSAVAVLVIFLVLSGDSGLGFLDVDPDAWYLEYIESTFQLAFAVYLGLIPVGFVLIAIGGIIAWRNQFKPAKFFLIATGLLVLFLLPISLAPAFDFYLFDSFNEGMIVVQTGIMLQLCFFALGMGNKRKMLEDEKMETQNQLVETQAKLIEEQNKVNTAFGRFVPHRFLEAIGRDSVLDIKLGDGVEREVTVFFSDIRGYTRLAEQMEPKENFQFLNGYLGRLGPIISDHQGFVNQYYGDGIMAIFMQSPENSLKAALDIQKRLHSYNEERKQKGRIPITIGIGMHTGPLIMGVIGDTLRMEAGVVSDTVNTAARMEGLTKHFGANILVSEIVFNKIGDKSLYLYRYLGKVQVKGRQKPLKVYDFYGSDTVEIIEQKQRSTLIFDQGIEAYYKKDFATATRTFEEVLIIFPKDKSSINYLFKSKEYLINGVPEGWNGVEEMKVK